MFYSLILFVCFCAYSCFASSSTPDQKKQITTTPPIPSKHIWTICLLKDFPVSRDTKQVEEIQKNEETGEDEETKRDVKFYNHSYEADLQYGYEHFGASFSVYGYRYQHTWDPDFSFTFGYYNSDPGGISCDYRSEGSNHFRPKSGEKFIDSDSGTIYLSYNVPILDSIQNALKFKADNPLGFSVGGSVMRAYIDEISNTKKNFKRQISLGVSYQITPSLSFSTEFEIFLKNSKQSSDSDFTYQLSYSVPLPRGQLKINYENSGSTRYPWNPKSGETRLALDQGSITLSWSCKTSELF